MEINFRMENKKEIAISCRDDINNLASFSETSVYLIVGNEVTITLANDVFVEIISSFNNILLRVIGDEHTSSDTNNVIESVGYKWNDWAYNLPEEGEGEEDIYNEYWIWSTKETGTWLYKQDGRDIILEISPIYEWHFEEPNDNSNYILYEDFIKNYKVLLKEKLDLELVKAWQNECERYLEIINGK